MPFYFEYENTIKKILDKKHCESFFINEDLEKTSLFMHFKYFFLKSQREKISTNYYTDKLKSLSDYFDYVFIIKGRTLSIKDIATLKSKYYSAKFIMYQWDSVSKAFYAPLIASNCDNCYTFDPIDAIHYNWIYRPLFYTTSGQESYVKKEKVYDIAFICFLHSRRAQILEAIEYYTNIYNKKLFTHMYSERLGYFKQKYINHNPSFSIQNKKINFKKLHLSETNRIYDQSFAVLDYTPLEQNGLTMRSIEALGHRCKLITNNRNIINEPFYNPNNIYIYDYEDVEKNGFQIPQEFFSTPYQDVPEDILYRYTIDGWIDDIFGEI